MSLWSMVNMATGESSFFPAFIRVCPLSQIRNPATGLGTHHYKQSPDPANKGRKRQRPFQTEKRVRRLPQVPAGLPALPSPVASQATSKARFSLQLPPRSPRGTVGTEPTMPHIASSRPQNLPMFQFTFSVRDITACR